MPEEEDEPGSSNIGLRIQMIRGKMTQQEFARKLNIKQCYISRYEKGRIPNPEVLLKIARFAKVSIEWLLTGRELADADGHPDGYDYEGLRIMTHTDKRIISYLSRLEEDDKKILLKIIRKMLSR